MFERFKNKNKEVEMIADLDAILVEPVSIKLHGQTHILNPLSVEQVLVFSNKYTVFNDVLTKEKPDADKIINGYFDLIHSVIPTITKEDIEKADQKQLGSLFGLIVRTFTGEIFTEKKTLKQMESSRPDLLN